MSQICRDLILAICNIHFRLEYCRSPFRISQEESWPFRQLLDVSRHSAWIIALILPTLRAVRPPRSHVCALNRIWISSYSLFKVIFATMQHTYPFLYCKSISRVRVKTLYLKAWWKVCIFCNWAKSTKETRHGLVLTGMIGRANLPVESRVR
jgi:hypothetical protein